MIGAQRNGLTSFVIVLGLLIGTIGVTTGRELLRLSKRQQSHRHLTAVAAGLASAFAGAVIWRFASLA
jgi:hypothetical protein